MGGWQIAYPPDSTALFCPAERPPATTMHYGLRTRSPISPPASPPISFEAALNGSISTRSVSKGRYYVACDLFPMRPSLTRRVIKSPSIRSGNLETTRTEFRQNTNGVTKQPKRLGQPLYNFSREGERPVG
jgi:hypothetical protein